MEVRRVRLLGATGIASAALLLILSHGVGEAQSPAGSDTRSPHGPLNIPCQNCHTSSGWVPIRQAPEFDHGRTRYPLRGMHKGVPCARCHTKPVFTNVGSKCADCHADIHKRRFGAACESCHSVAGWQVSVGQINQHQNRFPLLGAHAALDCATCHPGAATGQFQGLPTDCYACHARDYRSTTSPGHAAIGFPTACQQCHGMHGWFGARFDHLANTGVALTGAHARLDCQACHAAGFQGTPTDCVGCHLGDYRSATNPNHQALGFPQTCDTCHTESAWRPARFDHSTSGFPLTGAHAAVPCESCHVNGNYNLADDACVSCHMKDYQGTREPNHAQAGYSQECQSCHDTSSWDHATFDHAQTGFPLTGAHTRVPCSQCHVNGNYSFSDTSCASCHLDDYQGTRNPNHGQAGFSTACQSCHNTTAWTGAGFDHAQSGFPLTGAHARVPCEQCHAGGNYSQADSACVSCHMKDYQRTTAPNHAQAGYPFTCQSCHDTTSWGNATFDHSQTGFPLTGAHARTPCEQCHTNGNYGQTDNACVACHLDDYQRATDPNHAQAGFPTTCQTCHDTTSWGSGTFNHAQTGFPLTGAHATLPCESCHVNGNYDLDGACVSCHMSDYQGTTNPNHAQAGFPTTCETCHATSSWDGAQFNHNQTSFPLTGAHAGLSCVRCHASGVYDGLPTACASCHQQDYNGTTAPNHAAAGFPQLCELCHGTSAWIPASFNHNNTAFPLTGAHIQTPCVSCHVNNNYSNVPTDCYSCHKSEYQSTTNPNHAAAGFPTTCQTCHTTSEWTGATFDHTWFRVPHHGIDLCRDCHPNPSDYTVFACINCHTHNKTDTDDHHQGVNGYAYNSAACYQCHRNARRF